MGQALFVVILTRQFCQPGVDYTDLWTWINGKRNVSEMRNQIRFEINRIWAFELGFFDVDEWAMGGGCVVYFLAKKDCAAWDRVLGGEYVCLYKEYSGDVAC